jgi:hypothetical protein
MSASMKRLVVTLVSTVRGGLNGRLPRDGVQV